MTGEEAGRLRADAELVLWSDVVTGGPGLHAADVAYDRAAVRVARAMLGLLPAADAGEVVTAARLRQMPLYWQENRDDSAFRLELPAGDVLVVCPGTGWVSFNRAVLIAGGCTVGRLWHLLAALDLPLAPAAGGGA